MDIPDFVTCGMLIDVLFYRGYGGYSNEEFQYVLDLINELREMKAKVDDAIYWNRYYA